MPDPVMTEGSMPASVRRRDWTPLLLLPAAGVVGLLVTPSVPTWITLTTAGLAMGMLIFLVASGLTIVFGLMDVLNFGHGAFITVGAYAAYAAMAAAPGLANSPALSDNLVALLASLAAASASGMLVGLLFERLFVRKVYGDHLKQILVTMGGMIIIEQVVLMIFGPQERLVALPPTLRGVVTLGEAAVEKYRILVIVVGLVLFAAMLLVLARTRIGLLIRAGVEDHEMVRSLGYRIHRLFVCVFVAGAALAGIGGVMWVLYRGTLSAGIGGELITLVFIVIVLGGLGSIGGCFVGALLVAVISNYTAFLAPSMALVSTLVVMVAVLLWRPSGLYPLKKD
jgi:branched-chain amino acid transport system permease protein